MSYINECIKNEIIPCYEIIDDPFLKLNQQDNKTNTEKSIKFFDNEIEEKLNIINKDFIQENLKKNSNINISNKTEGKLIFKIN